MDDWCIKGGKFSFATRDKGKYASRKGKKDGSQPAVKGKSFGAAERMIEPKKSGKSFGKPR